MKIVFLDRMTLGDDVSLEKFQQLGEVVTYDTTSPDCVEKRVSDADVVVVNKTRLNETNLKNADKLKVICVTATGTDIIDKEYAKSRNIPVANVASYSTDSVAQHTFALLFYLLEHLRYFDDYVKTEAYCKSPIFCNFGRKFWEISGKTWGIIGMGEIGRKVASIAEAFGCRIVYYSTSGNNQNPDYERVSLETLLSVSDVVSVHAPLNDRTRGLLDLDKFKMMKPSAYFLNVGRGPIVVEEDLVTALEEGYLAGAGLDVVSREPLPEESSLNRIKESSKLFVTPHIAWASKEARQRLVDMTYENIIRYCEK